MSGKRKTIIFWVLLIVIFVAVYFIAEATKSNQNIINYSEVVEMVEHNKVERVQISGNEIIGKTKEGKLFKANLPEDPDFIKILRERNVEISSVPPKNYSSWFSFIGIFIFPIILIAVFFLFIRNSINGPMGKHQQFTKSKVKFLDKDLEKVTFDDVAGMEEIVNEVKEVVEMQKKTENYKKLNAKPIKGVLLTGPPGTGKTLIARAIASEAGVPFLSISGSDFVEMFVGVGAARVRDLFEEGRKNAPCIIFMDEIDAVGRQRGTGLGGGNDEREQTLDQLLAEMDGIEKSNADITFIAATNRPDVLDPALKRPGRFGKIIETNFCDIDGREKILKVHVKNKPLAEDVNLRDLARATMWYSGAQLEEVVEEAARLAAREGKDAIEQADFYEAQEKIALGVAKPSLKFSEKDKKLTAYHEIGHALIDTVYKDGDDIKRVTIITRGNSGGATWSMPKEDKKFLTKKQAKIRLRVFYGGRTAEEIFMGETTTGPSNDIERATGIAREMVASWGMSDDIQPIHLSTSKKDPFLGREITSSTQISQKYLEKVDQGIEKLVKEAIEDAKNILENNREAVEKMVELLFEKETIDGTDVWRILEECGGDKPNSL